MNAKGKLDELISFYEKHKPEAGKVIPVRMSESVLRGFAKQHATVKTRWHYRDRLLERVVDEKR